MIGQIVNCPKCNSMLQVTEPDSSSTNSIDSNYSGMQPNTPRQIRVQSHRGVIDSSAMTKESFAPELEEEYRLAPAEAESESANPAALVAPPRFDEVPPVENPLVAPQIPERKTSSGQQSEPNVIQLLAVRRTARRRQILMVAVLGSSGVLLAGMLFTGFLYWYTSKPKPHVAQNSGVSNQDAQQQKHSGPKLENQQEDVSDPLAEPEADPLDVPPIFPTEADPNSSKPPESVPPENSDPSGSENAAQNESLPSSTESSPTEIPEQPVEPNIGPPELPTAELPDQLKKFQSILDTAIEPQFFEDRAVQKAPPTAEELGLTSGADAKAVAAMDVDKQMQLKLTGLIIPAGSVSNVLSQWVQVSGVPTVVDLDSFAAAGVDPYKVIPKILVGTEQPLSQVGASIAQEMGVDLKTIENRFLGFQASESAIQQQMPSKISITDLLPEIEHQQWLVKTLDQIWPEYQGKWIVGDGELTVDPNTVDPLAWFWAVRMLESWRLAAGLETKLDKSRYDPSKFTTKFVDPDEVAALNNPVSLTPMNRAPVAQLVSDICAANQMQAWVDWASVSQKGLAPSTIDFIVTQGRTLRQCLLELAEKYSLVIALEDDKSVFITTAEVYRIQPRLFVMPSQGKTAEQWMEELQPLTPGTAIAVQPVQAFLTPDSRFVITRCCRPNLR